MNVCESPAGNPADLDPRAAAYYGDLVDRIGAAGAAADPLEPVPAPGGSPVKVVDPVTWLEQEGRSLRLALHETRQSLRGLQAQMARTQDVVGLVAAAAAIDDILDRTCRFMVPDCPTCGHDFLMRNCGGGANCGALQRQQWRAARGLPQGWG